MAVVKELRRFHNIFHKMVERCIKPTAKDYPRYGGRGIKSQWTGMQFQEFKRLMHPSYLEHAKLHGEKNTTLERIDVNGNYEEGNIRWATWREQGNNKRYHRLLTLNGRTQNAMAWSRETGIPVRLISMRIDNSGWSVERALTEPNQHVKHMLTFKGKTMSMTEWGKELGIPPGVISGRSQKGEPIEKILRPLRKRLQATLKGETYNVDGWAKRCGIPKNTIFRYLRNKNYKRMLACMSA